MDVVCGGDERLKKDGGEIWLFLDVCSGDAFAIVGVAENDGVGEIGHLIVGGHQRGKDKIDASGIVGVGRVFCRGEVLVFLPDFVPRSIGSCHPHFSQQGNFEPRRRTKWIHGPMHFGVQVLHATIFQDRQEHFSIGCFSGGGLSPASRQVFKAIEFFALRLIGHELPETFLNAKGLGGA